MAENSAPSSSGIYVGPFGGATLVNSIVVSSSGPNCEEFPPLGSLGYNLSSDSSCGLTQTGDIQGVDPKLGPLALDRKSVV